MAYRRHRPEFLWNVQFKTRMPLGYAIQDGDCPHSKQRLAGGRGVKRGFLTRYVRENLRRNEVLDFVSRDFSDYAWSLRTLDRRLQYFGITYTDRTRGPNPEARSRGPNWVHSLDDHDKLMGYQNSTFPIAVYGCMDTCSWKMLWAKVWFSNSNPDIVGRFYLEYLFKLRTIASKLRLDRGSETGVMATMHTFLRQHHGDMDPLDTVMYGPSTSN